MKQPAVTTGLDRLAAEQFRRLAGKRIGVVCNQASVSSSLRHLLQLLAEAASDGEFEVAAVFGPQHGLWGHTQDNMIEWEGGQRDPRHGWVVHSLYGQHRKPTPRMLEGLDLLLIDLQDVGARFYTFVWTMALCLEACGEAGVPVLVLDRPNPLGGERIEGPMLDPEFASFVGLYPVALCHGLTAGELALYLREHHLPKVELEVLSLEGWKRSMTFPETGLPWIPPSPNMPTFDTALVYPGTCFLEGTNVSEGRGTTRPFEMFGAPWVDAEELCTGLNSHELPGVWFRPVVFEPTFDKFAEELCQGAFVHVTAPELFEPVLTGYMILSTLLRNWPESFRWRQPPFEYEEKKLPIDILAGTDRLRGFVESGASIGEVRQWLSAEAALWRDKRGDGEAKA